MLDLANDIQSHSEFKRNSAQMMKRMRRSGNPVVLTVNGKADADAGRTVPAREFLDSLDQRKKANKK